MWNVVAVREPTGSQQQTGIGPIKPQTVKSLTGEPNSLPRHNKFTYSANRTMVPSHYSNVRSQIFSQGIHITWDMNTEMKAERNKSETSVDLTRFTQTLCSLLHNRCHLLSCPRKSFCDQYPDTKRTPMTLQGKDATQTKKKKRCSPFWGEMSICLVVARL